MSLRFYCTVSSIVSLRHLSELFLFLGWADGATGRSSMLCNADDEGSFPQYINCLELKSILESSELYNGNDGGDSLSIFHTNIRSYNKNFDQLLLFLNCIIQFLDIVVLTECWLGEGGVGTGLDGFDMFQTETQRNQNDGVIVYANKRLSATATQVALGDVYRLGLDFTFYKKHFHVLAIYRTFDSNAISFVNELEIYFNALNKNKMCIFLGDLNMDLLQRDMTIERYEDCLIGGGFIQCIDKPTRVTDKTRTCLDHIFIRYDAISDVKSAVIQTDVTDHYSTGLTVTAPHTRTDHATSQTHTYVDHALLAHYLTNSNWDPIISCAHDVNFCSSHLNRIIVNSIETAKKTLKNNSSRFKKLKPWITIDLIRQIRLRDKIYKQVKKQPFNVELNVYYRELRQSLNNNLKQIKPNYY